MPTAARNEIPIVALPIQPAVRPGRRLKPSESSSVPTSGEPSTSQP